MFRTLALCLSIFAVSACSAATDKDLKLVTGDKPDAPTELKAIAGDAKVTLTWAASARAVSYKVLRGDKAGGPYAELATVPAATYTDATVVNGKTYFYTVQGVNAAGVSANSAEASATPLATVPDVQPPTVPTGLVATTVSDTQIGLTWSDNSNNENGFKVERKTGAGGTYVVITTVGAGIVSYNDMGLTASTQYYYQVYAYNAAGNSGNSNEANATTPAAGGGAGAHWVPIPGGTFTMGDSVDGFSNELPTHPVMLSSFEMYAYEVTNGEYQSCVAASSCTAPGLTGSYSGTRSPYYGNATYANYPVVNVNWQQAVDFCTWAGGRLPTEAEWEYAARGGLSGKRFPWGDTIDCTQANYYTSDTYAYDVDPYVGAKFCATPGDTTLVGSYAANGGLYDMVGNVLEWVNDWSDSYAAGTVTNPTGPVTGTARVLRGGAFDYPASSSRVSRRPDGGPTAWTYGIGFRCVR